MLEVLAMATRLEKEMKGMQIGKKAMKLSLFVYGVILYLKDKADSTNKVEQKLC